MCPRYYGDGTGAADCARLISLFLRAQWTVPVCPGLPLAGTIGKLPYSYISYHPQILLESLEAEIFSDNKYTLLLININK